MNLDNSEMIASPLVFSVHVKVYGLLKWELAGVSYPTNGVVNSVWAVCLEHLEGSCLFSVGFGRDLSL